MCKINYNGVELERVETLNIDPCEGCYFMDEKNQICMVGENVHAEFGIYSCEDINYNTNEVRRYIWKEIE
jgi:hypothetical protein